MHRDSSWHQTKVKGQAIENRGADGVDQAVRTGFRDEEKRPLGLKPEGNVTKRANPPNWVAAVQSVLLSKCRRTRRDSSDFSRMMSVIAIYRQWTSRTQFPVADCPGFRPSSGNGPEPTLGKGKVGVVLGRAELIRTPLLPASRESEDTRKDDQSRVRNERKKTGIPDRAD